MPDLPHGENEAEARVLNALRLAAGLSVVILAVEATGALFSRSLSLTVDAVHNVPDLLAFFVSWLALAGTRTGTSDPFTFGTHRREVFAGLLNGVLVLGTGLGFGYAAVLSLAEGRSFAGPVDAVWLLAAVVPTLLLRTVSLRALGRIPGRVRDLNLASVVVHLASDLAITGALLVDGVLLLARPDLLWVDAAAAAVIAAVLVGESIPLMRDGYEVLTERAPRKLSLDSIRRAAMDVPGVTEVHDVHVWAVCSALVCMTAHVGVRDMTVRDSMGLLHELRDRMASEFGIVHATFELEVVAGA
jgi:cobalt-zinc-cadmium efflux system protein